MSLKGSLGNDTIVSDTINLFDVLVLAKEEEIATNVTLPKPDEIIKPVTQQEEEARPESKVEDESDLENEEKQSPTFT